MKISKLSYLITSTIHSQLAANNFCCTKQFLTIWCPLNRSFGGCVSWESHDAPGATYDEQDDTITHQIVDRPSQDHVILSR